MARHTSCPSCGARIPLPRDISKGFSVACPSCGRQLRVASKREATATRQRDARPGSLGEDDDPLVGTILGGCAIEAVIGKGGMGVVYRAQHQTMGRQVAIKVLPPEFIEDRKTVKRFVHEARIAGQIIHPNLVQVYDVSSSGDGIYFIVMEYVEGANLDELVKRDGPLTPEEAASHIAQVARGLDKAHARGVVHRDVKPANMLLEGDLVKLSDFGLATSSAVISDTVQTATPAGQIVGTPQFMAPEQCQCAELDARTDVYALGLSLYFLAVGQHAFTGPLPVVLMSQINQLPAPPHEVNPDVPEPLSRTIMQMVQKAPGARLPSAEAVARALEHFVRTGQVHPVVEAAQEQARQARKAAATRKTELTLDSAVGTRARGRRRRPEGSGTSLALPVGGALVLAAVVVALAVAFGGGDKGPAPVTHLTGTNPIADGGGARGDGSTRATGSGSAKGSGSGSGARIAAPDSGGDDGGSANGGDAGGSAAADGGDAGSSAAADGGDAGGSAAADGGDSSEPTDGGDDDGGDDSDEDGGDDGAMDHAAKSRELLARYRRLLADDRLREAIAPLEEYLRFAPDDLAAWRDLVDLHGRLGDRPRMRQTLIGLLAKHDKAWVHERLAGVYLHDKELEKATTHLERARALKGSPRAAQMLVRAYLLQQRTGDALALLAEGVTPDPPTRQLLGSLRKSLYTQHVEALFAGTLSETDSAHLRAMREVDPLGSIYHLAEGWARARAGRFDLALPRFQAALKTSADPPVRNLRGSARAVLKIYRRTTIRQVVSCLIEVGRLDEALAWTDDLLESGPMPQALPDLWLRLRAELAQREAGDRNFTGPARATLTAYDRLSTFFRARKALRGIEVASARDINAIRTGALRSWTGLETIRRRYYQPAIAIVDPGATTGLQKGDLVVKVRSKPFPLNPEPWRLFLDDVKGRTGVTSTNLRVLRGGKERTAKFHATGHTAFELKWAFVLRLKRRYSKPDGAGS